jgi:hypothetical protein
MASTGHFRGVPHPTDPQPTHQKGMWRHQLPRSCRLSPGVARPSSFPCGPLAHRVEQGTFNPKVASSRLARPTRSERYRHRETSLRDYSVTTISVMKGTMTEVRPGVWRLRVLAGRRANGSPMQLTKTMRSPQRRTGAGRRMAEREPAAMVAEASKHRSAAWRSAPNGDQPSRRRK